MFRTLLFILITVMLVSCGRRGQLGKPEEDIYPRQYPQDVQTTQTVSSQEPKTSQH